MNTSLIPFLKHTAYELRRLSIQMTTQVGSGHPTSALSAADIMAVLFFSVMRFDPHDDANPNNDRFILSKGHASPLLYALWQQAGVLSEAELMRYRHIDSPLEGHPTFRFPRAHAATGSLGMGLSIGAGLAYAGMIDERTYKTYVLLGDSELSEGSVWEAAQIAAFYKLSHLIAIVDCNQLGQSTAPMAQLEGHEAERYARMFDAFGWKSYIVDGHDVTALCELFKTLEKEKAAMPIAILAKTRKGYGVEMAEGKEHFHGKAFTREEEKIVLEQLRKRFAHDISYQGAPWKPTLPQAERTAKISMKSIPPCSYQKGTQVATRKVYGEALVALGAASELVVSLDAEVKNSTYAELFETAYPERFIQCFIAEQNMVSMAVGMQRCGKVPFVSTFGAFLTRAHDQLRMAAIGAAALRVCGSHAGVSIGQDGPSQMALEDIAMMRSIPESIVLYPSDAVSTYALVELMGSYHKGISYLRTTRMATPVMYDARESFSIGGCKILRKSDRDRACVIGAGVTLHEALKAYELLQQERAPISISVIDLYSIKPLDWATICDVARASGDTIITVEDHYLQGGLGEAVTAAVCNEGFTIRSLAVTELPRSGKPEELLALAGIDAAAIIKAVYETI